MVRNIQSEPDYEYWCKFDSWNLKNAALLLHSIDPLSCSVVRFNTKEVSELHSLKNAHKTFLLLKNIIKTDKQLGRKSSFHPYEVYAIATKRNIRVPEELTKNLHMRYEQEQNNNDVNTACDKFITFEQHKKSTQPIDKEISTRERRALLKSIGIMAVLLMEDSKYSLEFTLNDRPNASRIAEAVLIKAQVLGISPEGIKSLERKIREAVALLIDEEV